MTADQTLEARQDLADKGGDKVAYDVHTHDPNDPATQTYGAAVPLSDDEGYRYSQPGVILGYKDYAAPDNSTGSTSTVGGSGAPRDVQKTIGFYNSGGSIITLKYNDFKAAINKIFGN